MDPRGAILRGERVSVQQVRVRDRVRIALGAFTEARLRRMRLVQEELEVLSGGAEISDGRVRGAEVVERFDVSLAAKVRLLAAVAGEELLEQAKRLGLLVLLRGELAREEQELLALRVLDVRVVDSLVN